jgi:hypothetical protein
MVHTIKCPHCGKILWFSSRIAGTMTICPACGGTMRLDPPPAPATPTPDQMLPPAEEAMVPPQEYLSADDTAVPAVVEEQSLTHQAAAAVGEVHVDVEEEDLVQWTMQPPPLPGVAPVAPPEWAPPPLTGSAPPPPPPPAPNQDFIEHWPVTPPASSVLLPVRRVAPVNLADDSGGRISVLAWSLGAVAVLLAIVGVIWILGHGPSSGAWEQAHREQILSIKQDAEQLALAGRTKEAYDKYQELERLVAGQTIEDPYLRGELETSWTRRDALYLMITSGKGASPSPSVAAPPATAPSVAEAPPASQPVEPAPIVVEPATAPSEQIASTPPPATTPSIPVPQRPAVHPVVEQAAGITDAKIGQAIKKGADFLIKQFHESQIITEEEYHDGLDSLAVYALLQCGLAIHDPRLDVHDPFMMGLIDAMKRLPMKGRYQTYGRAIRATGLALYDREDDHWVLKQDVNWLLHAAYGGAFSYNDNFARQSEFAFWDNSNSQYGLLGVWAGAESGVRINAQFWREVQTHWTTDQFPDGQWHYVNSDAKPRLAMTLAGIASLFVAQDYLGAEEFGDRVGRPPFSNALAKALTWLENGDNCAINIRNGDDIDWSYTLYGLERVGLASGFKYFGPHDWYREQAAATIAVQNPNGSWTAPFGDVEGTSYALLFLARGRHPVIINKLRFDGDWANRPRDAANLARFASTQLERPLNWQVVSIDHDWPDWTDSPLIYLSSDVPPPLTPDQQQKIKSFILNGGMLLTQADGDSAAFTQFVQDLGKRLFPQYAWTDLPPDSTVWSISYHIAPADQPPIRVISNGSRILMMHWPKDLSRHWQLREDTTQRSAFELGTNLVLYTAGKTELKNRLESNFIVESSTPPAASIRVARLKYDGNWDPEPAAFDHADRWFRQQTGLDMKMQTLTVDELADAKPPIAYITGTARFMPSVNQVVSLRSYVQNGGLLIVDPCGMPGDFFTNMRDDLLPHLFFDGKLDPIDVSHPVLTASGDGMTDVSNPQVRQFVRAQDITDWMPLMLHSGKGHVILLPLDTISGLLGCDAWGIAGYKPEYSLALLKNIVLWAWDGQRDGP